MAQCIEVHQVVLEKKNGILSRVSSLLFVHIYLVIEFARVHYAVPSTSCYKSGPHDVWLVNEVPRQSQLKIELNVTAPALTPVPGPMVYYLS